MRIRIGIGFVRGTARGTTNAGGGSSFDEQRALAVFVEKGGTNDLLDGFSDAQQ
jgi:hypothetical protein